MTGADVKRIREALGRRLGRRVSQHDLGIMLGLAPKNAKDTVRHWEDTAPTGPAALALTFVREATDLGETHGGERYTDYAIDIVRVRLPV